MKVAHVCSVQSCFIRLYTFKDCKSITF